MEDGEVKMKKLKLIKAITSLLITASVFALSPTEASAEWISYKGDTGVFWKYTEGNSYANGWRLIDGNWYYFNEYGDMETGTYVGDYYINLKGVWTHLDYSKNNDKFNEFIKRLNEIEKNDSAADKKAFSTYEILMYARDFATQYDALLNDIYNYNKEVMQKNEFEKLQNEEIKWINEKETAIVDSLDEHKGSSMCAYLASLITLGYTHDRIYELLK